MSSTSEQTYRLLVVDDDEASRVHLRALLQEPCYEVVEAADGERALELVGDDIDLVLLDLRMPGIDGIDVCRRVKQSKEPVFLPVIFVSGSGDRQARLAAREVGADDFLNKPVEQSELLVRVRNLLQIKAYYGLQQQQSEILQTQLEQARQQLLHSERLATLGTLAGGVGHELGNIAGVFLANLDLLRMSLRAGDPVDEEIIEQFAYVGGHLRTHAKQLLSIARPGPDYVQPVDLRDVVGGTLAMLYTAGKTKYVKVECELPDYPLVVSVNRSRIEQILINLMGNAVDACEGGSAARVRVEMQLDKENRRVCCRVADEGSGIPPDRLSEVLEAYVTTKPPGKGTGLGLPVAKGIVESYGGSLKIESQLGSGTTVSFDLPWEGP